MHAYLVITAFITHNSPTIPCPDQITMNGTVTPRTMAYGSGGTPPQVIAYGGGDPKIAIDTTSLLYTAPPAFVKVVNKAMPILPTWGPTGAAPYPTNTWFTAMGLGQSKYIAWVRHNFKIYNWVVS